MAKKIPSWSGKKFAYLSTQEIINMLQYAVDGNQMYSRVHEDGMFNQIMKTDFNKEYMKKSAMIKEFLDNRRENISYFSEEHVKVFHKEQLKEELENALIELDVAESKVIKLQEAYNLL